MDSRQVIEIVASVVMLVGVTGLVVNRIKTDKGVGVRAIQFAGIVMLPPVVLILALEGIMEHSAAGTLVGALAGYLFGEFAKRPPDKDD